MGVVHHPHAAMLYLDGSHLEVNGNLLLSDLFEGCHGDADVVQVFDLPVQLLPRLVYKDEDLLHLRAVLPVAVEAVLRDPAPGFSREGHLQVRWGPTETQGGFRYSLQLCEGFL